MGNNAELSRRRVHGTGRAGAVTLGAECWRDHLPEHGKGSGISASSKDSVTLSRENYFESR